MQDKITREGNANCEIVTCVSRTIRSIEQLLDAIGVTRDALNRAGTSEWLVESYDANKWDQGVLIGTAREHRVVELWQVKAKLRRRVLLPLKWEPVKPFTVTLKLPSKSKAKPLTGLRRELVIPDSQHWFFRTRQGDLEPTHDRDAWACMLAVAEHAKPTGAIYLGDMIDMTDLSDKFVVSPEFRSMAQPALVELAINMLQVRALLVPFKSEAPRQRWIEGNHEYRLPKACYRNLQAASELRPIDDPDGPALFSIENLMQLRSRLGVEFLDGYPHAHIWLNNNLYVHHGEVARSESGATSQAVLRNARYSEVYGHIHRIEQLHKTVHPHGGAVSYMACCPGTLARIDGAVPAATSRVNWQQGFGLIDYEPGNGRFWIQLVQIHDGVAIYDGRLFRGKFSSKTLEAARPSWLWKPVR